MKWGEFKNLVKLNTIGELQLPDDEALKLALEAVIINDIASFVTPTRLIEQDIEKAEMLFSFPKTKNFFIRKPFAPVDDESEIDLDNELCHTAVFYVSELFLKDSLELNKKAKIRKRGDESLQNYLWNFQSYIENMGICDDLSR